MNLFLSRLFILMCLPVIVMAAPAWQMVPNDSAITFTATQNNAPVKGGFKTFTSEINFDPADLTTSHIKISIDMNSVTASYGDVVNTLKSPDWFDTNQFPQAVFDANHFTKINDNTFQADGMLTLRDKTLPATVMFKLEQYSPTKAQVKGNITLKRTAFGVGRGEWSKTDTVKDDVLVEFTVNAVKK